MFYSYRRTAIAVTVALAVVVSSRHLRTKQYGAADQRRCDQDDGWSIGAFAVADR